MEKVSMEASMIYLYKTCTVGGNGISDQYSEISSEEMKYQIVVNNQSYLHPKNSPCGILRSRLKYQLSHKRLVNEASDKHMR